MKHHWLTGLLLLALGLAMPARAADDKKKSNAPPAKAQARFKALTKEYDDAASKYSADYSKAKTDEEKEKLRYPDAKAYAKRFLALADESPNDSAAIDSLVWVASKARSGAEMDTSLDVLLKDHLSSDKLGTVANMLLFSQTDRSEPWLRTVMEKSPHVSTRAIATHCLGRLYKEWSGNADLLRQPDREKDVRGWMGDKVIERVKTDTAEGWMKKAETLFETVIASFPEAKSSRGTLLADSARGELFETRNLGIGMVVPEITGEDAFGKPFKLSDYRGKVVVIDFWGDW